MNKLYSIHEDLSSPLIKVIGILLLFLLTSCPIKASIKQSFVADVPIEQQSSTKQSAGMMFEDAECSIASSENIPLFNPVQVDSQMQPFVMLLGFVMLFFPFLLENYAAKHVTNTKTPFSKGILLLISRLNL